MKHISIFTRRLRNDFLTFFFTATLAFTQISCALSEPEESPKFQNLKVANWNLQTFFDAVFDGNEYTEYKSAKSGWSTERYEERLDRLASVIKKLDADIFIMEELEKESQLQDIANRLTGTFDFSRLYTHGFFAAAEGSSIGCGVISRYPLEDISVHTLDVRTGDSQPPMRPIMQFSVTKRNRTLTIFVNHWKSKSSGAEASEIWRKRQEKLLSRLMKSAKGKNKAVLATGDFNKDISEFDICIPENSQSEKNANLPVKNVILHGEENLLVYSPWILKDGEFLCPGSYWYKNDWERIDHFFAAGDIVISDFCAESEGDWAFENGQPRRYQLWNGKGYSDHLPISCTVSF